MEQKNKDSEEEIQRLGEANENLHKMINDLKNNKDNNLKEQPPTVTPASDNNTENENTVISSDKENITKGIQIDLEERLSHSSNELSQVKHRLKSMLLASSFMLT